MKNRGLDEAKKVNRPNIPACAHHLPPSSYWPTSPLKQRVVLKVGFVHTPDEGGGEGVGRVELVYQEGSFVTRDVEG